MSPGIVLILGEHSLPPTDHSGCFQPGLVNLISSAVIAFVLGNITKLKKRKNETKLKKKQKEIGE